MLGCPFVQLQDIPLGKSLLPLSRVTKPLSTGLFKFPRGASTSFITSLPCIGYRLSCFSLNVGSTASFVSRPETNTYDW